MAEYYYFAATLPMLSMDREAPITYSAFMEQAKAHLTRRDYSDLEKAVMAAADGDAKLPLVRAWQAYAGRIRRLMNSYRAARLGFPGYEAREGGDRMLEAVLRLGRKHKPCSVIRHNNILVRVQGVFGHLPRACRDNFSVFVNFVPHMRLLIIKIFNGVIHRLHTLGKDTCRVAVRNKRSSAKVLLPPATVLARHICYVRG